MLDLDAILHAKQERIDALHAVDVHVDEAGHDETFVHVDDGSSRRIETGTGVNRSYPTAFEQQRGTGENPIGQHHIAAGEHNHFVNIDC